MAETNQNLERANQKSEATISTLEKEKAEIEQALEKKIKSLTDQLAKMETDVNQKVDAGHNSVKKMVDIHKTNEDLSG